MAKECNTCIKTKNKKSLLLDNGTVFSLVNHRPNAKFHFNAITKEHKADLRNLTNQEWADILPLIKDGINKIENYFQKRNKPGPLGYRISIPVGKLSGENFPPHFYARIVPKYKKEYNKIWSKRDIGLPVTSPEAIKLREVLQPNQDNIVQEKQKTIAKLPSDLNFIPISTKNHLPNDINAIDQETWNEIGEMLKELMAKIEANASCHDFQVEFILGKEAAKMSREEAELPADCDYPDEKELVINLFPRWGAERWWKQVDQPVKDGKPIGTMENDRYAERLRDYEKYAQEWGKKSTPSIRGHEEPTNSQTKTNLQNQETKDKESLWKQPSTYLLIASGALICLLGMGTYWLFSKKTTAKSK